MEEWNKLMAGRGFLTDLGAARPPAPGSGDPPPGRYAVWSPLRGGEGHTIVEVGDNLAALMERYQISPELVCTLVVP